VLYGLSGSLWNGTAYVAYLKKLGHDKNGPLGDIEAVSGLATLITALPVGYLADRLGRSKVITAGGFILLCTTVLQIGVMEWVGTAPGDKRTETALLLLGSIMWLWGIGDGVVNGPCAALYADSTPRGERSIYYTYLFACYSAASAVGPLVSIVLFQTLGDDWSLANLRVVIYVGLGIEILNSFLMMLFDDKKTLDESGNTGEEGESTDTNRREETEALPLDEPADSGDGTTLQRRQKWIPFIIFVQSTILAVGSGMTIKFFPLFFKDDVGMSPSQVQVIYCLVPFVMIICSTATSKIAASGVGRVQTQLITNIMGVSLLFCMVFFKTYLDKNPVILVPIFVMRTSLMNASYPLQESILMDFVPKESRARWKSLDAVASFGWCGSAAFGGWLADKYDYTFTFFLTAIIQSVGIVVWSLLLPLVPRNEGGPPNAVDVGPQNDTTSDRDEGRESLEEPLLSDA
jgi:MFS family permease